MDEPALSDNVYVSNLIFTGYDIDHIGYHINSKFQFKEPLQVDYALSAKIKILDREQKTAIVSLLCIVFNDAEQNNYPFSLTISLSGRFIFNGDIDNDGFLGFCKTSGLAVLFPYLRSAISNITSTANMQPLMLPLINVQQYFKDFELFIDEENAVKQDQAPIGEDTPEKQ